MARQRNEDETLLLTISQASPIERFFGSYSEFQYNPSGSSAEQYQHLRKLYGWQRGDSDGERAWSGYRLALVKEFNRLFGTDPKDLLAWQTLCMVVGIRDRLMTCDDCIRVRLIPSSLSGTQLITAVEFAESALQHGGCDRCASPWRWSCSSISNRGISTRI